MLELLAKYIKREAKKRLSRHQKAIGKKIGFGRKYRKRTGRLPSPTKKVPPAYWGLDKHFDPIYCIRHRKFLARGIWNSLKAGKYRPRPAYEISIPKASGGTRTINIFAIPDAALSNLLGHNLIERNTRLFSASSFAYRHDRTPLDAIIKLRGYISKEIAFVINFDFRKYFDSISHDWLKRQIYEKGKFLSTTREREFVSRIIKFRSASLLRYLHKRFSRPKKIGIPQGTTISLFLANAAAHELDLALERRNGCFVRFADDSVVIAYSYEDALKLADEYVSFSEKSSVAINYEKSQGVRILNDKSQELKTVESFSFLGYQFSKTRTSISAAKISYIKKKISKTIYIHLLLYPNRGQFNPTRIGGAYYDWDLVTCINEIRRYIYGGLPEKILKGYLNNVIPLRRAKGLMAYYCLVDDHEQLHALDGWLLSVLMRAHQQRIKVLAKLGHHLRPLSKTEFVLGSWYRDPIENETNCPSFFLAWRAARKKWEYHGASGIEAPKHTYAYF